MQKISYIVLNPRIGKFHYEETPHFSLRIVLQKLQKLQVKGKILKMSSDQQDVGVQFPNMKELLWFKAYEVKGI